MEPIFKEPNTIEATEVLYFPECELEKTKNNQRIFATMGPMSVLYLKDYKRFVLQINDWKYPLLRRLPIMCPDKNDMTSRMLMLPAMNGATFSLKIMNIPSSEMLNNLETILRDNAGFHYKGEDTTFRKLEGSPDDKLMRKGNVKKEMPMMPTKEMISETIKLGIMKAKIAGKTLKDGTKNMGSTKKRMYLKDIKNKNWKKTAHTTFKKDWFDSHEKMTKDIHVMRKHNFSNFKMRNVDDIRKADHLPVFYLPKEDVEECILVNKDLATMGKFNMEMPKVEEKKGFMDSLKQGLQGIKDSVTGRVHKTEEKVEAKMEGMAHYEA